MKDTYKQHPDFDNHEELSFFEDTDTGLKGVIAIHSTILGPATGGTRFFHYANEEDGLRDVLRLSKAMTYKCALAGVNFGGGKAVIFADPSHKKNTAMLHAYGEQVNALGGRYTTGTDVGLSDHDTAIMGEKSVHILGHKDTKHSTSQMAALGVFYGIQAAAEDVFGSEDLSGKVIGVKGLGKIGMQLCEYLSRAGARLVIADINNELVETALHKFPKSEAVSAEVIHTLPMDIYAPCAMGGEFTLENCLDLQCKIIAGGANNQLSDTKTGDMLHARGIIYIPDYVINAGGLIHIVDELEKEGYNESRVMERILRIKNTIHTIITTSRTTNTPTYLVADRLAEEIIYAKRKL